MRRRFLCLAVLALVGMAVLWGWSFPHREPLHKGRPIGYWVNLACERGLEYRQEIIEIGPPALPYLTNILTTRDNPFRDAASALHHHLPAWLQQRVPKVSRSSMLRWRAGWAISWLGSNAAPAVPALTREISDPNRAEMSMALALRAIGAEARLAIPALHSALDFTNQTPYFRIEVAWAIWSIARDTNLVLKVCTNALHTDQAAIRATWMLADIGESARETAPLLLQVLQDTNRAERLRSTAAWALGAMLPRESRAFPALAAATSDAMPLVRLYAAAALWKADNRHVSNAVPVIVESLLALRQSEYQEGSEDFAQFVEHFQLPVNDCVPSLKNLLDGGSPAIREAATNALQKIGAQLAVEKPRE